MTSCSLLVKGQYAPMSDRVSSRENAPMSGLISISRVLNPPRRPSWSAIRGWLCDSAKRARQSSADHPRPPFTLVGVAVKFHSAGLHGCVSRRVWPWAATLYHYAADLLKKTSASKKKMRFCYDEGYEGDYIGYLRKYAMSP